MEEKTIITTTTSAVPNENVGTTYTVTVIGTEVCPCCGNLILKVAEQNK